MLKLHLIRHAKTKQDSPTAKDYDRELLPKGIAQANLLGHVTNNHHIDLGMFLVSGATRTRQTFGILKQHLPETCSAQFSDSLYHAEQHALLQEIYEQNAPVLTIIGHNNGISDLASYLTGEYILMQTCELITLSFAYDSWQQLSRQTGIIEFRYRPEVFVP